MQRDTGNKSESGDDASDSYKLSEAALRLGRRHLVNRRYPRAIIAFDRACQHTPYDACTWLACATAKFMAGKCEESLADVDHSLQLSPDFLPALGFRVTVYTRMGRRKQLMMHVGTLCETIVSQKPKTSYEMSNLASCAVICGVAFLYCGCYQDAVVWLEAFAQEDYSVLTHRGIAKDALGRHEDALADLNLALVPPNESFVAALRARGRVLTQLGRPTEAVKDLTRAHVLVPGDASILKGRGMARLRLGQREGALADLERAHKLQPDDEQILTYIGVVNQLLGRHTSAQASFDKALSIQPCDFTLASRGISKLQNGRVESATQDLHASLVKSPQQVPVVVGMALSIAEAVETRVHHMLPETSKKKKGGKKKTRNKK